MAFLTAGGCFFSRTFEFRSKFARLSPPFIPQLNRKNPPIGSPELRSRESAYMLRSARHSINPDLDLMVENLLREESEYDRVECRSAHREHLVRGVIISIKGSDEIFDGFSRNISTTGIGIITSSPVPENATAVITIESIRSGVDKKVLADSRWCKPYGKKWFVSGWQFINVLS